MANFSRKGGSGTQKVRGKGYGQRQEQEHMPWQLHDPAVSTMGRNHLFPATPSGDISPQSRRRPHPNHPGNAFPATEPLFHPPQDHSFPSEGVDLSVQSPLEYGFWASLVPTPSFSALGKVSHSQSVDGYIPSVPHHSLPCERLQPLQGNADNTNDVSFEIEGAAELLGGISDAGSKHQRKSQKGSARTVRGPARRASKSLPESIGTGSLVHRWESSNRPIERKKAFHLHQHDETSSASHIQFKEGQNCSSLKLNLSQGLSIMEPVKTALKESESHLSRGNQREDSRGRRGRIQSQVESKGSNSKGIAGQWVAVNQKQKARVVEADINIHKLQVENKNKSPASKPTKGVLPKAEYTKRNNKQQQQWRLKQPELAGSLQQKLLTTVAGEARDTSVEGKVFVNTKIESHSGSVALANILKTPGLSAGCLQDSFSDPALQEIRQQRHVKKALYERAEDSPVTLLEGKIFVKTDILKPSGLVPSVSQLEPPGLAAHLENPGLSAGCLKDPVSDSAWQVVRQQLHGDEQADDAHDTSLERKIFVKTDIKKHSGISPSAPQLENLILPAGCLQVSAPDHALQEARQQLHGETAEDERAEDASAIASEMKVFVMTENGNHSGVMPLASQLGHPGLPAGYLQDHVPGPTLQEVTRQLDCEMAQCDPDGLDSSNSEVDDREMNEETLGKELQEECTEEFANYLELMDDQEMQDCIRNSSKLIDQPTMKGPEVAISRKTFRERRRPKQWNFSKHAKKGKRRGIDLQNLTIKLLELYKSLIPSEEEKMRRRKFLSQLDDVICKKLPGVNLFLYGSWANTFGFCSSDIDVCLTVKDTQMSQDKIVVRLARILEANNMQNVQALTHARVPIVKLTDPVTGTSCDISVNNMLAVVNSKLIYDYAKIDVRLGQLAFIVKHWAKCRQVNETYRGTLSSYAYVLMCINFLQQRNPPILPCLQEMQHTYHVDVGRIECAYHNEVELLSQYGSQNKESIGNLVVSFFEYWAFHHDYKHMVISVRTGKILSKDEKDWMRGRHNEHLICIEDPFEVSHNLGRVVDYHSLRVLRDEFYRAAKILHYDCNPSVTLFEPYTRVAAEDIFK